MFFIAFCLAVMLAILFVRQKKYSMTWWKVIVVSVYTGAMGLLGTKIMFWIENGYWFGRSFFGAMLFLPILLFPLALFLKIPLFKLLDYVTPAGMAMLIIYKYNCLLDGCCGGKVLNFSPEGIPSYFPSQKAEMVCAIIITCLLLILEHRKFSDRRIYPFCLIAYGISRFVLNFYRWENTPFFCGLTAGHFWSIVSFLVGIVILVILKVKYRKDVV